MTKELVIVNRLGVFSHSTKEKQVQKGVKEKVCKRGVYRLLHSHPAVPSPDHQDDQVKKLR